MDLILAAAFGVMTHFAQFDNVAAMPLFKQLGATHIRDEQYWNVIEGQPRVFTFPAKFTSYMAAAKSNGLATLIVLDWSNRYYDYSAGDFTFPHTDAGRAAFVRYALEVLMKYPEIKAVEVWNEVNAGTFIKGPATSDKAGYYALLLKALYPALKAARPDLIVIAGATVPVAHGFFRDLAAKGASPFFDAVSVHPYVSPEVVSLDLSELRKIVPGKPIWVTEFSSSTQDINEQARYTTQMVAEMLSQGVDGMFYYLGIDSGNFANRGLLSSALSPRPVYYAYSTAIKQLQGARFVSRWAELHYSIHALKFDTATVIWSKLPSVVRLSSSGAVTICGMLGEESVGVPQNGKLDLHIDAAPRYLRGPITSIVEVINPVIADAESGYSNTQGRNGWQYGYATVAGEYNPSLFKQMTWGIYRSDNFRWIGLSSFHFVTESGFHPDSRWAMKRWTSNFSGRVEIACRISRGTGGDGVDAHIFVNGNPLLSRHIAPGASENYVISADIASGDVIDFAISQGGNNANDSTVFTATITAPLPSRPVNLRTIEK